GVCGVLIYFANQTMPTGFVPSEDRGFIMANIELPQGATGDRVVAFQEKFRQRAMQIPEVEGITLVSGFSFISGQGSNYGMGMLRLKKFEERKDEDSSIDAVIGKLFGIAAQMPESKSIFFAPPSVPGYGFSSGFEMKLLDKSGGSLAEFNEVAN